MKKKLEIEPHEMRTLLFWATAGFVDANGGTGERKLPKLVKRYAKDSNFNAGHWPSLTRSNPKLTGETSRKIIAALKEVYPKAIKLHYDVS